PAAVVAVGCAAEPAAAGSAARHETEVACVHCFRPGRQPVLRPVVGQRANLSAEVARAERRRASQTSVSTSNRLRTAPPPDPHRRTSRRRLAVPKSAQGAVWPLAARGAPPPACPSPSGSWLARPGGRECCPELSRSPSATPLQG